MPKTLLKIYIQARSEATLTHGLCEACIKELYPSEAEEVIKEMREAVHKPA